MALTSSQPLLPSSPSDPFLSHAASNSQVPLFDLPVSNKRSDMSAENMFSLSPEAILRVAHGRGKIHFRSGSGGSVSLSKVPGGTELEKAALSELHQSTKPPSVRPTVSFSPTTRHHPYDPELRTAHISTQSVAPHRVSPHFRFTPPAQSANASVTGRPTSSSTGTPTPLREVLPNGQSSSSSMNSSPSSPYCLITPRPTPTLTRKDSGPPRSILKRHPDIVIRVVGSVEEGTRGNAVESRRGLLALGLRRGTRDENEHDDMLEREAELGNRRPGLVAKDSYLVELGKAKAKAVMRGEAGGSGSVDAAGGDAGNTCRGAAGSGSGARAVAIGNSRTGSPLGKLVAECKKTDGEESDPPSTATKPGTELVSITDTPNTIQSLLSIICHETNDLDSIEDAYGALFIRMRKVFCSGAAATAGKPGDVAIPAGLDSERPATEAERARLLFKENTEGLFKAFMRDVERLVGLPPDLVPFLGPPSPPSTPSRSPSELAKARPPTLGRVGEGSSPLKSSDASPKAKRKGYSAAEVRRRRAEAGCGQNALKVLAFVFNRSEIFTAFSEKQIISLLKAILVIPATPELFTPNSKKTYPLAIYVFAHIRVPITCLDTLVDSILHAVTQAVGEASHSSWGGGPGKREGEGGNVKARSEGFSAISNLCGLYPSLFLEHHERLLPPCIRALSNGVAQVRNRAAVAVGGMVKGKLFWVKEAEGRILLLAAQPDDELNIESKRSEAEADWLNAIHVGKSLGETAFETLRTPGPSFGVTIELTILRRTLEANFRSAPQWASTVWANITSVLGECYTKSVGNFNVYKQWNESLIDVLRYPSKTTSFAQFALGRLAWNHAIHALIASKATPLLVAGKPMYKYRLTSSLQPVTVASVFTVMLEGLKASPSPAAEIIWHVGENEEGRQSWIRQDSDLQQKYAHLCCGSGLAAIQVYLTAIKANEVSASGEFAAALTSASLDALYDGPVRTLLRYMLSVRALDDVLVNGWELLRSMVQPDKPSDCTLRQERILQEAFLSGELVSAEMPMSTNDAKLQLLVQSVAAKEPMAKDLPAWGSLWVAERFEDVLQEFGRALFGIEGVKDCSGTGTWVNDAHGRLLMPAILADVWRFLLIALVADREAQHERFLRGFGLVIGFLADLHGGSRNAPPFLRHLEGYEPYLFQLSILQHLFETTVEVLREEDIVHTRIPVSSLGGDQKAKAPWTGVYFGVDSEDSVTATGVLTTRLVESFADGDAEDEQSVSAMISMLSRLTSLGANGSAAHRFLGDLTDAFPALGAASPVMERAMWTLLSDEWGLLIAKSKSPLGTVTTTNNRTGALLLDLLKWPFQLHSEGWQACEKEAILATWSSLCRTAVARCVQKKQSCELDLMPSICGFLEPVISAGSHTLHDFAVLCVSASLGAVLSVPTSTGVGTGSSLALNLLGQAASSLTATRTPSSDASIDSALLEVWNAINIADMPAILDLLGEASIQFWSGAQLDNQRNRAALVHRISQWLALPGVFTEVGATTIRLTYDALRGGGALEEGIEAFRGALIGVDAGILIESTVPVDLYKDLLAASLVIDAAEQIPAERSQMNVDDAGEPPAAMRDSEEAFASKAADGPDRLSLASVADEVNAVVGSLPVRSGITNHDFVADSPETPIKESHAGKTQSTSTSSEEYSAAEQAFVGPVSDLPDSSETSSPRENGSSGRVSFSKRKRAQGAISGDPSRKRRRAARTPSVSSVVQEEDLRDCIVVASPPTMLPSRAITKSASTGMMAAVKGWLPQLPFWSPNRGHFALDGEADAVSAARPATILDEDQDGQFVAKTEISDRCEVVLDAPGAPSQPCINQRKVRRKRPTGRPSGSHSGSITGACDPPAEPARESASDLSGASRRTRRSTQRPTRNGDSTQTDIMVMLRQVHGAKDSMDQLTSRELREVFVLLDDLRERHKLVSSRL